MEELPESCAPTVRRRFKLARATVMVKAFCGTEPGESCRSRCSLSIVPGTGNRFVRGRTPTPCPERRYRDLPFKVFLVLEYFLRLGPPVFRGPGRPVARVYSYTEPARSVNGERWGSYTSSMGSSRGPVLKAVVAMRVSFVMNLA